MPATHTVVETSVSTVTMNDGTRIYYKDWGEGQPVVFSHGWPLSSDAFEDQMFFLTSNGYRCIAHDRRGHGRSSQPWNGNNLDTYADDLAELTEALDLKDAIHVGHSTGGGEVVRYIGRHGSKRVAMAVLIGGMLANMCVESHLRDLLEQGFEVAVASDATAAPRHPDWGYGYTAALINFKFLAHWVPTADDVLKAMK